MEEKEIEFNCLTIKKRYDILCGNCGKMGHVYRKCKDPITSFGIIALKKGKTKKDNKILMVQRKDTMGYVELVRGRYPNNCKTGDNIEHLKILIQEMTKNERERLMELTFNEIWDKLWINHNSKCYENEYYNAKKKYEELNIKDLIKLTENKYIETEWGIPKGRRNKNETNKQCAIREFEEETGYNKDDYILLDHEPIEERFTGTNNKMYKHIYYIAYCYESIKKPELDINNKNQIGEIKNIKWFNLEDALKSIREYDIEKKKIINKAFEYI